ncbi:hypothetical protein [Mycobacterium genavense]|uniref:hypothetical protein n=1 Tax=Mycobacterium genavense TaxID=36812 RepID=UPI0012EC2BA9|nr:hypothetical protein [Mycobacterium genavense]
MASIAASPFQCVQSLAAHRGELVYLALALIGFQLGILDRFVEASLGERRGQHRNAQFAR